MSKKQIKSTVRKLMAWMYYSSGHLLRHLQGKVSILLYHRIVSKRELDRCFVQPGMFVRDDVFEKQIQFLKQHFNILSFSDLLQLWREKNLREDTRYCVLTFDDGWEDNYIYAYPVLRKYNTRATIFLPTDFVGTKKWFWSDKMSYLLDKYYSTKTLETRNPNIEAILSEHIETMDAFSTNRFFSNSAKVNHKEESINSIIERCKECKQNTIYQVLDKLSTALRVEVPSYRAFLNWRMIEEMSHHGISFGSHTHTHRILTKLSSKEIEKELHDSRQALKQRTITTVPVLAYPNGNYNKAIQQLVSRCGYEAAVSTRFGYEHLVPRDLTNIKRIAIHNDVTSTVPMFVLSLSGYDRISRINWNIEK